MTRKSNLQTLIYIPLVAIVSSLLTSCSGGSYCEKLQAKIGKDLEEVNSIPMSANGKYFDVPPEKYQETLRRYEELWDRISSNKQLLAEACTPAQNP